MTSPTSLFTTWTELVTTTYRAHKPEVADAITKHNALARRVKAKGRTRRLDGGLSIVVPLEINENGTYQRYSGYDPLNIQAADVLTAGEFPWQQAAVNVAVSGREMRMNKGDNLIINLVKTKVKNAQKSAANNWSIDLYSAGTAANQINGLQSLVADAGTGTVGGIDSSVYTVFQNVVQSAAAPLQGGGAITPSATTIESLLLPTYIKVTRGADEPDIIVMSDDYFTFYEQSQTSLKRYAPADTGKGGMTAMKYKNADVFFDSGGGLPSAHAYMLNTDYLENVVHEDADWEIMPELASVNQDAKVIPVIYMGNLTVSNRKLQAVVKA